MADGTAWSGRYPVTVESQTGSLPVSVALESMSRLKFL